MSRKGRERNLIELIRIDETQHNHNFIRTNDLFETVQDTNEKGEDIEIEIKPKDLYEVPQNILMGFIVWIFSGRAKHYIMVVDQAGNPIKEIAPKVSGKVLKVARDWKGLGKAIKDAFGSGLNLPAPKIILIIVGAIIVLGFLIYSGYIPLPKGLIG